jgi:PAS domain S-box-containing protein
MRSYREMERDELLRELTRRDEQLAEARRQADDRYNTLSMFMSEGFFVAETLYDETGAPHDYRYLEVNPAFERITGRSRCQIVGKRMKELFPVVSQIWAEVSLQVAASGGPSYFCYYSEPFSRTFELLAFRPAKDRYAVLISDITESKRAEQALRESEGRLRLFVEQAPACLAMFDPDMNYLCASRRWVETYCHGHKDIIGRSHYEMFPDTPDEWRESHRRALSGEVLESDGEPFLLEGGAPRWAAWKIHPWYDGSGNVGGIVLYVDDITSLKQAEEALRESEQRYRDIVENQSEYVDRYLPGGYLTFVNSALARSTGLEPEQLLGKSFFPFVHEEDREQLIQTIEALSAENPVAVLENRVELPDGLHWLQWKHSAITDAAGAVIEYQATGRDITEVKRMQDALLRNQNDLKLANELLEQRVKERTADLEAAIRAQESFSYSVSHDLRAPLRHINSFSAMIMEEHAAALPLKARNYLERIRAASSRMGALIDHLLELSRVTRTEIDPGQVDLSELAVATLRMFQETDPHRSAEVTIEEGITVMGDRSMLGQLLENLLGNAWKYTSNKPLARIEFGKELVDGQEAYFVRDNGAGFDMTYSQKLFKAFERLHGAEFEGIGIGLATAQSIIERHGGAIWAEGRVGRGATFYFTLPVYF